MKVGILTFHDAVNYGAVLQAYATQEALLELGVDAEIIDYTNSKRQEAYEIQYLIRRTKKNGLFAVLRVLAGIPLIVLRKKKFHEFCHNNYNLSDKKFHTPEQLKTELPKYDYYMVGSDQVWNYDHNGEDMSYLLDFVSEKDKTISYASSFGLTSIPEELKADYIRCLNGIKWLSVREEIGANIVESLIDKKIHLVLDPVFLLTKERWESVAKFTNRVRQPYILLYTTKATYYDDFLNATGYGDRSCHIAHLTTSPRPKDMLDSKTKLVFAAGPEEFLGLVKNAALVLTSSFHGTAMSIIFQKQFISFLSNNEGKDARIAGLLNQLGLINRIFNDDITREQVDKQISYDTVQKKLDDLRGESISFLRRAMNLPAKEN